jgi:hypothetical protein
MVSNDEGACLEALARAAATGRLHGLEIEVWHGGGQPPPYYRSDQFRLLTQGGRDIQTFARPLFYPGSEPETLMEQFRMEVGPEMIRTLAGLIQEGGFFARSFPEETHAGGADAFSTELILTFEGRQCQRRYFRRLPEAAEPLMELLQRAIAQLKTGGRRGLFDQGREVAEPSRPPDNP